MKIFDTAKYLIYLSSKQNYTISPLKLQKLLYYCQGFSFAWDNKKLFNDDFEAWQYGPVNRDIYDYFKVYGQLSIPSSEGKNIIGDPDEIETIEAVWNNLKSYSPFELVENTHNERPWLDAVAFNDVISKKSIKDYFKKYYS